MQTFFVGLDIGGTSGRLILEDTSGQSLGTHTSPGCTLNVSGYEESRLRYRELVLHALAAAGLEPAGCRGICVAASGIDTPEQAEQCRKIFLEMGFADESLRIVNDCEVFLVGRTQPAAILVAGTGSIAMARGSRGDIVRKGGWGQLLSDEGSAFHIGLQVLRAIGDHMDGRLSCPILYDLVSAQQPFPDTVALNTFAMEHICDKPAIAGLARLADQAAAEGDAIAAHILLKSADDLYAILRDALQALPIRDLENVQVLLWGSVLVHCAPVAARVRQRLRADFSLCAEYPAGSALEESLRVAPSSADMS